MQAKCSSLHSHDFPDSRQRSQSSTSLSRDASLSQKQSPSPGVSRNARGDSWRCGMHMLWMPSCLLIDRSWISRSLKYVTRHSLVIFGIACPLVSSSIYFPRSGMPIYNHEYHTQICPTPRDGFNLIPRDGLSSANRSIDNGRGLDDIGTHEKTNAASGFQEF